MKRIFRSFGSAGLSLFTLSAAAYAHGFHAPVAPRLHATVHLLQLVGVVALVAVVCLWVRKRARR
jgi:hypothetical protein